MSKASDYYKELLDIARLKYPELDSLNDEYDLEISIADVIRAGNEFILAEPFLYCLIGISFDYPNYKTKLKALIDGFATYDFTQLVINICSFYSSIYYLNDIYDRSTNSSLAIISDLKEEGKIPLLNEYIELLPIIDDKLMCDDYIVIRDILLTILVYCLMNHKEDNYKELCSEYVNCPYEKIDELILNGVVRAHKNLGSILDYYCDYMSGLDWDTAKSVNDKLTMYIFNKMKCKKITKKIK